MMVAEPENFIEQVAKSNAVDEASGMSTVVNYRCVIYFSSPDLLFLFFPFFFPFIYIARSSLQLALSRETTKIRLIFYYCCGVVRRQSVDAVHVSH